LKIDERYASSSREMLKALFEKTAFGLNRKNLNPIEKIKALLEARYQVYETDPLNITDPFRYQRAETHLIPPHHYSCRIKDAVRKFTNAILTRL
jgi:hypothetical protein